jgi:hypothetical protein
MIDCDQTPKEQSYIKSSIGYKSTIMASKCVHRGCGKTFSDPEEQCNYHRPS